MPKITHSVLVFSFWDPEFSPILFLSFFFLFFVFCTIFSIIIHISMIMETWKLNWFKDWTNFNSNLRLWKKFSIFGFVFFASSLLLLNFINFDYVNDHSIIEVDVWWILDRLARVNHELEKNYITRSSFVG